MGVLCDVDKTYRKRDFFSAFLRLIEKVIAVFGFYHCYDHEV